MSFYCKFMWENIGVKKIQTPFQLLPPSDVIWEWLQFPTTTYTKTRQHFKAPIKPFGELKLISAPGLLTQEATLRSFRTLLPILTVLPSGVLFIDASRRSTISAHNSRFPQITAGWRTLNLLVGSGVSHMGFPTSSISIPFFHHIFTKVRETPTASRPGILAAKNTHGNICSDN